MEEEPESEESDLGMENTKFIQKNVAGLYSELITLLYCTVGQPGGILVTFGGEKLTCNSFSHALVSYQLCRAGHRRYDPP